jgi:hypothetical protein
MKAPLALAGAVMLVSSLAACGGDDSGSAYCKDLKQAASTFDDLDSGDIGGLETAFTAFHDLADEAPGDVKAEWKVLEDGISGVEKALDDAGIKFSDMEKIQANELPEGVDPTKLQGLASSFTALSDEKFSDAADTIQVHARDVCDVELK